MAELVALIALVALLLLGAGATALGAVLDGRRVGVPGSLSLVAPLAEAARLLRSRRPASATRIPVLAGAGLLVATAVRVLALPIAGAPLLGGPVGLTWLAVADLVWWTAGALLVDRGAVRRHLLRALAIEAPLLVALAIPVLAAGSLRAVDVLTAQRSLPFAVEAPVAFLLVLVVGGVLVPDAVETRGTGTARFLVAAAHAVQPVSAAAVAAVLLLGTGGSPAGSLALAAQTALLAAAVVVVAGRFPALRPPRLAELALRLLLPLALVQLGVVVALTLLGGRA